MMYSGLNVLGMLLLAVMYVTMIAIKLQRIGGSDRSDLIWSTIIYVMIAGASYLAFC